MTKQSFENSFSRLEEILSTMQEDTVSLDDSIKLYEEANKLLQACSKQLKSAEQTVETLVKKRDGNIALDDEGSPITENL